MRTALDAPESALDDGERNFVRMIREHGWFKTSVFGDAHGPGFAYTTGFTLSLAAPELIAFAMQPETLHTVWWDLFNDLKAGRRIMSGVRTADVFANLPVYFFPVSRTRYPNYVGWSRWFYGNDNFPCWHMVWADRYGRFPWEVGFDQAFPPISPTLQKTGGVVSW